MASFDTQALISAVKVRAALPAASNLQVLTDAQILVLANEELLPVVALLKKSQESFFQTSTSQAMVAGQASYRIPSRAIAAAIHQAIRVDASGAEFPLSPLGVADVPKWRGTATETGTPHSYYVDRANVVLVPAPATATETLKLVYESRPGRLVDSATEASAITAINTGTRAVTVASAPAAWPTASSPYDFVAGSSPFECRSQDAYATRSSNVLTFAAALPTGLAVGDYVALPGESPVAQIPLDLHPLLKARTLLALLTTLGELEAAGPAVAWAKELIDATAGVISPRVSGQAVKAIGGPLRAGMRRFLRRP